MELCRVFPLLILASTRVPRSLATTARPAATEATGATAATGVDITRAAAQPPPSIIEATDLPTDLPSTNGKSHTRRKTRAWLDVLDQWIHEHREEMQKGADLMTIYKWMKLRSWISMDHTGE